MTSRSEKSAQTLLLLALMISEITGSFEAGMMYAALPTMNKVYGDPSAVGWLITAFLLVGAASAAICGRLGDIFGRSRVLILMLALAGLGSLISQATEQGRFNLLAAAVATMAVTVVAFNRLVWKPLGHLAEVRYSLET